MLFAYLQSYTNNINGRQVRYYYDMIMSIKPGVLQPQIASSPLQWERHRLFSPTFGISNQTNRIKIQKHTHASLTVS